ncbi:hypothetical protein [Haloarcula onubensis]|uniref:Uncharacterized protein n=1 Tax=Haloarcula onubensis TaxID=2950539 RepID=A0ABU2FUK3_9EURY|nr:hypothetical protein [Halomicroarcula sp. S3CR25-11]MDS0284443.1 hypothetical protein [Halomicroarcula sp. S3CR25-11]
MTADDESAGHCTPVERVLHTDQVQQRGQVDGRLIRGAVVAIVFAVPLSTAAVDIQSSLAAVPGFSWLTAAVVALLLVAAMVAAVVEGA